jgi:two-component system, OmpR family, KDP operon response regulator KdpE
MDDTAVSARFASQPHPPASDRARDRGQGTQRRGSSSSIRVLIVERDRQIQRLLRAAFASSGYQTSQIESHARGIAAALNRQFDLIVVEVSRIGCDGMDLIRNVRAARSVPVLALATSHDEAVTVEVLDCGADDCLAKPFGVEELLARSRSLLRRLGVPDQRGRQPYAFGRVRASLADRWATIGDVSVHLTRTEFRVLACLLANAGKPLTHRHLLAEVWGASHVDESQYLRVFVQSLRRKLETEPSRPKHLITELGVGYRFVP